MLGIMEPDKPMVQLGSKENISYLKPASILKFGTIQLMSLEGQAFRMDKTVLAAASKFFCDLLLDQEDCNEKVVFHTEIPKIHLSLFCQFVCTGTLPSTSLDPNLVLDFNILGVELEGVKNWETISAAALPGPELDFSVPRNEEVVIKKEKIENGDFDYEPSTTNRSSRQSTKSRKVKVEWENSYEYEDRKDDMLMDDTNGDDADDWEPSKGSSKLWPKEIKVEKDLDYQVFNKIGIKAGDDDFDWQMDHSGEDEKPLAKKKKKSKNGAASISEKKERERIQNRKKYQKKKLNGFGCMVCTEKFPTRHFLRVHTQTDHADTPATCHICNMDFARDFWQLKLHVRSHNKKKSDDWKDLENWDCIVCEEKCTSRHYLNKHMAEVHADMPVACQLCNFHFPSQDWGRLKNHMRKIHPNKKDETFVCICCGEIFDRPRKLQAHLRKKGKFHNNKCAYKECMDGPEYKTWLEHQDHVKKVHGGEFPIRCGHCPEIFQNDYMRGQHIKKVHPDLKTTANLPREMCTLCGKIIFKYHMQEHLDRHHGTNEHPCDECQKIFYSKQQLKCHKETHLKVNPCPECGKHFTVNGLRAHILQNHTPDHLKPYPCPHCPKGYTTKNNLKYHIYTHTGEKPFKCHICNAAFNHPANQKAHILAHEGIKRKK